MSGPLLLIDAMNLYLRNYAAVPTLDVNGGRCGGWFGTLRSIKTLIREFKPSNILVVWDGEGGSQARRSIMGEYKAGRKVRLNRNDDFGETPQEDLENMLHQRQLIVDYLGLLGIPQVRCDAVEADDLIAWISRHMDIPDVLIVSTDQDMLQLICAPEFPPTQDDECPNGYMAIHNDLQSDGIIADHCVVCKKPKEGTRVRVWSPIKKIMFDKQRFVKEYGVLPENYRLMKAMTGDASDNVKGIKGLGVKTFVKLFPSLAQDVISPMGLIDMAIELRDDGDHGKMPGKIVESQQQFMQNLKIVDLSEPLLSGTAARQAREALYKDVPVKEIEMRIRLVKDGLTISDQAFVSTFREQAARRRKVLGMMGNASEE